MYDITSREEEIKKKVAEDYFSAYDTTRIIGNIDFCVAVKLSQPDLFEQESLLWAECKRGARQDIYDSFVQLILTIGRARTFDKVLPPAFLGAFDAEKIAFLSYEKVLDVFYRNDFNWTVTPSDHETREFKQVRALVCEILDHETLIYHYGRDDKELHVFIKRNFIVGKSELSKIRITKNNFISVYQKWCAEVKPTIAIRWEGAKAQGILDADFYLADILSKGNLTLQEKLRVLLRSDHYEMDRLQDDLGLWNSSTVSFNDNQVAHTQFWNRYHRPPKREYWETLILRRDLLVPQDVRERKGSFFTPQIWVEKSQEYLEAVLGENWQEEYTIWDCCAGTGNLLNGLTNKYNIWASTLEQADVDVMRERVKNGANLLDSHIFQFDFLNDSFDKLPAPLQAIIHDEEQRKKLVIYINPPYAEVSSVVGRGKAGVNQSKVHDLYGEKLGTAGRELFTQFLIRIDNELENSIIANFSKLKTLQGAAFTLFRENFKAKLLSLFVVPADTFDNVRGDFPIGFFIWDTKEREVFNEIVTDVYDSEGKFVSHKTFFVPRDGYLNKWINLYKGDESNTIGFLAGTNGNDFQHNNIVYMLNLKSQMVNPRGAWVSCENLIPISIYFAVRHCIEATWLNDRDQFLFPNEGWKADRVFQADCLIYTLFHGQNRISATQGVNHWIPFTEPVVDAKEKFDSSFMTDFMRGKLKKSAERDSLFEEEVGTVYDGSQTMVFSAEAQAVLDAGRALWRHYHAQENANPNASFYDIRRHFQGVKIGANGKERMNNDSSDATYTALIQTLRIALKALALCIEPKVYAYAFLK